MIIPVEYKCVVRPMDVLETDPVYKSAVMAGIRLPEREREREQMAQVKAELMAVGGSAFEEWGEPRPKPGDIIVMAKYAGVAWEDDGVHYRIINDKDIAGILE